MSDIVLRPAAQRSLALLRIGIGWLFFWACIDKLFGLGFSTAPGDAWLAGNSPTAGFLQHGTSGPFASFFQSLVGSTLVDWLFMLGLAGIGFSMLLGIGMRLGGLSGVLLSLLIWASQLPPSNNPFFDNHMLYVLVFIALPLLRAGEYYGLGQYWKQLPVVQRWPWLQ